MTDSNAPSISPHKARAQADLPKDPRRAALDRLAECCGLLPGYQDGPTYHPALEEGLIGVLNAVAPDPGLDLSSASAEEIDAVATARAEALAERWLEPVVVSWMDEPPTLPVRLGGRLPDTVHVELTLEDNSSHAFDTDLAEASEQWGPAPEGGKCIRRGVPLPADLPMGYHRARVEFADQVLETTIIRAPRVSHRDAADARSWGVFTPAYAIRSERDTGCGDLSDLRALSQCAFRHGAKLVGTLPMNAVSVSEPFDPSPYAPISRRFWNELYIDPCATDEYASCDAARAIVEGAAWRDKASALRDQPHVDWRAQHELRRPVLDALAEHFFANNGSDSPAFKQMLDDLPDAADYAAFRARMERERAGWVAWDDDQLTDADRDAPAARTHLYAQHAFRQQLDAMAREFEAAGATMYLDLPLGVTGGGYDTFKYRGQFRMDLSVGAPPDAMFSHGQLWGFHPPCPDRLRETGYTMVRDTLHAYMSLADCLRLDHIMGMHRLFVTPQGMSATHGVYLRYHPEEQHAVMNIESVRHKCRIVGEDLGMVPKAVKTAMTEHKYAGMYVAQIFAQPRPSRSLAGIPEHAIASLNTHDMPPFAAWWEGKDISDLKSLGLLTSKQERQRDKDRVKVTEALARFLQKHGLLEGDRITGEHIMRAATEYLAATHARMVLINAEDLWNEQDWQNVPGTQFEHKNWTHRWDRTLEQLAQSSELVDFLRRVDKARAADPIEDPAANDTPASGEDGDTPARKKKAASADPAPESE